MNDKITFVLPSRSRVVSFFETIGNIIENCIEDNYEIICTLDLDDATMNNDVVKSMISKYGKVTAYWGVSNNKVDAINKNCDKIPEDTGIVILVSDDQKFIVKGFDDIIRTDAQTYFPNNKDFCLHYLDGTPARNKIITMNIFGIAFFKRFGYFYNPEYFNVFCDNEVTQIAKITGRYKFINNQIYSHSHPVWGTAPMDDLYKRNEEPISYQKDKETYFRRFANNFGL